MNITDIPTTIIRTVVFIKADDIIPDIIVEEADTDDTNYKIFKSDKYFRKQSISSKQL